MKPASLNKHAALRGLERGISPDEIRTALRRGKKQPGRSGFLIYSQDNLIVVWDPRLKRVVTVYRDNEVSGGVPA